MQKQLRHFGFTWNNYPENYEELLNNIYIKINGNYLVVAKEIAPTTGTPHLQGYLQMSKRIAFDKLRKITGPQIHVTICNGSSQDNIVYCKKTEDFIEWGEHRSIARGRAKQERDWSLLIEQAENNNLDAIRMDNPKDYLIYYRTLQMIAEANMKPMAVTRNCYWIYGKSGIGKSRICHQVWPDAYWKNANKWWDGYKNQRVVVLDDLGTPALVEHLKRWADRYKIVGEIKGGSVGLGYEIFVVTSNFHPRILFAEVPRETLEAIQRRFQILEAINWDKDTLFVKNCDNLIFDIKEELPEPGLFYEGWDLL